MTPLTLEVMLSAVTKIVSPRRPVTETGKVPRPKSSRGTVEEGQPVVKRSAPKFGTTYCEGMALISQKTGDVTGAPSIPGGGGFTHGSSLKTSSSSSTLAWKAGTRLKRSVLGGGGPVEP
jgi:hypothetical protein